MSFFMVLIPFLGCVGEVGQKYMGPSFKIYEMVIQRGILVNITLAFRDGGISAEP